MVMSNDEDLERTRRVRWDKPDVTLSVLVKLANHQGTELPIRLTVSAGVISGTLIGGGTYFREIADVVAGEGNEVEEDSLAGGLASIGEEYERRAREESPDERGTAYIHLRDAELYDASGGSLHIGWWRGRLTSVSGWSVGSYTRES